jgi:hypothetical protein
MRNGRGSIRNCRGARRGLAAKTIYNRVGRWSERRIWQKIFEAVAARSEPPKQATLDSGRVKPPVPGCGNGDPQFVLIGFTKGASNSKLHAIVDEFLRPWVLILTPGDTRPTALEGQI